MLQDTTRTNDDVFAEPGGRMQCCRPHLAFLPTRPFG